MTLRTPISPVLTGWLAGLRCSFVMLTFVLLLRVRRRLLSMLDILMCDQHEVMNACRAWALVRCMKRERVRARREPKMSCKRSEALFRSSSFFPRAESIAGPGTRGAPSSVAFFTVQWGNWQIGSDVIRCLIYLPVRNIMKFKLSSIVTPLKCLTLLATNGSGPQMVMPSIKPMDERAWKLTKYRMNNCQIE